MRKDMEKIKQYLKDNRNDDNIYELISQIEDHLDQGDYISYAKKRFSKNGGAPNPLTANDDFTKTFLTTVD